MNILYNYSVRQISNTVSYQDLIKILMSIILNQQFVIKMPILKCVIFIIALLSTVSTQPSVQITFIDRNESILQQPQTILDENSSPSTTSSEPGQNEEQQSQKTDENEKNEHGQEENTHHVKIPGVGLSIVFIFGTLLYGAILKYFSRISSIPYNPLLLISGIILGIYYKKLGIIGQATELISNVHPNGILALFLPCLIFQSAFKTQWHVFKKLAGQSLIIGILSSIVGASIIMIFIKVFLDSSHNYSWHEALLMGSIMTCTDILSFVHKLKRGGTPQRLTSLIEGQSLFNYCTCVLIFQFMQYYKQSQEQVSAWDYISLFLKEVFGGIVFGVIVGAVAVYCIKRMIYDGILVVALMVIFTYSIYMVAEFSTLSISGIISLAVFALYMNAFGKTWLFGQTEEYVENFWSYLVYVAETSIFMIAGVLVGANIIHIQNGINISEEYVLTIYIYIAVLISRFISISVFIRYLRKLGEGLHMKEVVVLTFAGLKGAIGISLAMQVFKNNHYDHVVSCLIMMHVTANSLLTLFIQGLTTSYIVKILGISSLKKVQYKFFKEYLNSFQANVGERLQEIKIEKNQDSQNMIDWEEVHTQINLPKYEAMTEETQQIIRNKQFADESKFQKSQMYKLERALKNYQNSYEYDVQNQMLEKNAYFDLEVQFRKRFLKDLIAKYWEYHQQNETTPAALMLLIQSANYDLDKETQQIESWNWIKNEISFNMRIFAELMKIAVINELAKSYLFEYVSFCYDVVSSYIKANEEVREELLHFYHSGTQKNIDEQSLILRRVLKQSQQNQKQAEYFLVNYLEPSFPQIQKEVKTRKVSFHILHTFKSIIDKYNQNGQLEPNQYDQLNNIIDNRSLELNLYSPKWQSLDLFTILSQDRAKNIFKMIPQQILMLLSNELGEERTYDANEVIIDNGEIAKHVYFVKKGGCIVQFTNDSLVYKQPMLAGQLFGFQALITNTFHSKSTANTMAQIVQVKKSLIIKVFEMFPQIEQKFWKSNIFQCYKMFVRKDDITYRIGHFQKEELEQMISNFRLQKIQPKTIQDSELDMIFIRGNIEVTGRQDNTQVLSPQKNDSRFKQRKSRQEAKSMTSNNPEEAWPFCFISRLDDAVIKINQASYFLVGELNYDNFERISMRLSRNGRSFGMKKKNTQTLIP